MSSWWRGGVTYQIYPRSFQDSTGNGIGDLPGITRRLQHVAGLGVDSIWLSPIFPSPMADMGYDVSDYTDIDPLFGTLDDFDALVARAHALGLRVIIDQVLSHTSNAHPWFQDSRSGRSADKADWYVWADPQPDGSPPNNWVSVFSGPAWEWDSRRRQYYFHNFLPQQPDLNFHNPEVQDALLETMRFWLDRGVDGFRLDTVNFYFHDAELRSDPPSVRDDPLPTVSLYGMQQHVHSKTRPENVAFLQRMRSLLDGYDDRALVGEVGDDADRAIAIMAEYTRGDDRLHMAYSFDMLGMEYSAAHFRSRIEDFFAGAPDGWPCWSFSNHDVARHVSRWLPHAREPNVLAKQAAAMLLSFRGSVCLYQGEELGLTETELTFEELTDPPGIAHWPDYKGRDGCRTPIPWEQGNDYSGFSTARPWLPIKEPQARMNVADQSNDPQAPLAFYRDMLIFRRRRPVLREAQIRFFDTDEPVLAYSRGTGADALVCVFNLSPGPVVLQVAGLKLAADAPDQAAALTEGALSLGPNGFAFLDAGGATSKPSVRFRI